MKLLFLLLMMSFNVFALDVVQNASGTSTISCTSPAEYSDGSAVRADDIIIRLYLNGEEVQNSKDCIFVMAHSLPVGGLNLHVTAYSRFYQTESIASNVSTFNVYRPLVPNAPTQLDWE